MVPAAPLNPELRRLHQEVRQRSKECKVAPPTSKLGRLRETARKALEDSSIRRKIEEKLKNPDETQAPDYA